MHCKPRHMQAGFTLVEQIMVLAVLAVLVGIALPSLSGVLQRHRLQAAQTDYIAALQYARSVAVSEGTRTLLCPSRDGRSCNNDTDWTHGWLLGRDRDNDGQPDGEPLRVGSGYSGQLTVLGDSGRRLVRFQSDGSAGGTTNTWRICRRGQSDHTLVVVIANSGRVRGATATAEQAASCAASG